MRSVCHAMGLRFRLHRKDLPGSPDLVFPKFRLCLFVHDCFWHRHPGCRYAYTPKTQAEFWSSKFIRNRERDLKVQEALQALGWRIEVVWECETKDLKQLRKNFNLSSPELLMELWSTSAGRYTSSTVPSFYPFRQITLNTSNHATFS